MNAYKRVSFCSAVNFVILKIIPLSLVAKVEFLRMQRGLLSVN